MTQRIRIMPCLDMQGGRVVKGVHFVDIRDAGDPVECARSSTARVAFGLNADRADSSQPPAKHSTHGTDFSAWLERPGATTRAWTLRPPGAPSARVFFGHVSSPP